ncbi:hypothetical protein NMB1549 [Neisseria meningitidis MC58]|uniref:Uncharacterized protein n=1 Tax=Neisseria meningitidis serogroup B (strain ATCC BAA-335 / MC58) TaxID=122586 RepID=Q9JYJ9_NEIMB|nr:hypothetical protein NMB1549 [Neisseria meningitidis MC58]
MSQIAEKRGGIGDKREGGVPTAPPRRECGAKSFRLRNICLMRQPCLLRKG